MELRECNLHTWRKMYVSASEQLQSMIEKTAGYDNLQGEIMSAQTALNNAVEEIDKLIEEERIIICEECERTTCEIWPLKH